MPRPRCPRRAGALAQPVQDAFVLALARISELLKEPGKQPGAANVRG